MNRIYADFNTTTIDGAIRLTTIGSIYDISATKLQLKPGEKVILYQDDNDFEVTAKLCYNSDIGWTAIPDWNTKILRA